MPRAREMAAYVRDGYGHFVNQGLSVVVAKCCFLWFVVLDRTYVFKTKKLKFELDKFQELIPDQPKMPNCVTASGNNSILDQLTHLRAQGIYQSGGVPNSAMEQS